MARDAADVLLIEMHCDGGPIEFDASDHEQFVDAFYEVGRDRDNKIVSLTGIGDYMAEINFGSFGNVADANVWSKVHDEGTQILENIANIRVPVIAAIEGRAHIHTEYALLANVVVAGRSVTFNDLPHFAGGLVPGDGVFTTGSLQRGPTVPARGGLKLSCSIPNRSPRRLPPTGVLSTMWWKMGKLLPKRTNWLSSTSSNPRRPAAIRAFTSFKR
jgi:hypothetical protein